MFELFLIFHNYQLNMEYNRSNLMTENVTLSEVEEDVRNLAKSYLTYKIGKFLYYAVFIAGFYGHDIPGLY